jgi:putative ABC transport system permease protein
MNKQEIIWSSFRIIRRNKMRTFFMVLGIVISIAALVLTIALGKGFQRQISERAEKYLGSNSIVVLAQKMKLEGKPFESGLVSSLTIDDLKAIASELPMISMYDPVQFAENREVIAGNRNISTNIRGSSVRGELVWNRGVTKGVYFDENDELSAARVALIGPEIAEVLFKNQDPVGQSIRIAGVPFTVKGVLSPKGVDPHGNDLDLDIIVPITTLMRRLLNVDYIMIGKFILNDESRMDEAVNGITAILKERHQITNNNNTDFMIVTPSFVKEKISEMTKVFNVMLPLIALIALLVAAIVIVVLMIMSVNERLGEIGLRKAVGARSKDIAFQFITETSVISMVGGLLGMLAGFSLFAIVSVHLHIAFDLPVLLLIGIFILPVCIGIISGIIPAQKAAKYNPVDALKQ